MRVVSHDSATSRFRARRIDDAPELLRDSYRLRYQVYCLERQFLPAEAYPAGFERDEFDAQAVHVGAIDTAGRLAGTARLIRPSVHGALPAQRHCTIAPEALRLWSAPWQIVEVSRMAVSRDRGRAHHGEVFLTVLKALYQASRQNGVTHWLAAVEVPLHRLLLRHGFPFVAAGPPADYYGPVVPYVMDLAELELHMLDGSYPRLADFAAGLDLALSRPAV